VYFQFLLPGQSASVRLSGQVVWQDWNGRAGVQFMDVPKASRKLIGEFLTANLPTGLDFAKDELQDVTVEMDEGQVEHVSIPLETLRTKKTATVKREAVPQKHAPGYKSQERESHAPQKKGREVPEDRYGERSIARTETHTDDRRTQNRYACRIGAEVYRTGINVPNHCNLTDLSSGGCYLEVSLPFQAGSSVEIVVRTYELKLRLRGVVQASHPGYGMGIAFELKTKEERENVRQLLDFVAATIEPSN